MEIVGWVFFIAGLGACLYVMYGIDGHKANHQPLYLPPNEQNPLFRGKDGFYSRTRGRVAMGIFIAASVLLAYFVVYSQFKLWFGVVLGVMGLITRLMTNSDLKRYKRNMASQRDTLESLRIDPEGKHVPTPSVKIYRKNEPLVLVSGSFYDFAVPTDIPWGEGQLWDPVKKEQALAIIKPRLVALSKMDESEWFKVGRATKV